MNDKHEKLILETVRQSLEDEPQKDSELLGIRLAEARRQALACIPQKQGKKNSGTRLFYYFGGAISASVLTLLIYIGLPGTSTEQAEAVLVSDFEILLLEDGDELEMLENDLDFYVWLETANDRG